MLSLNTIEIYWFALPAVAAFLLSYWWVRNHDHRFSYRWVNAVGAVAFVLWRSSVMDSSPEDWTVTGSRIFAAVMMAVWVGGVELGALMARDAR
jgi:hypothetical protein